jgi:hypothetical protein
MKCVGGKFKITNSCRGPKHCLVLEKPSEGKQHFECDDSVTEPGDPCEDEGEQSCSPDKKSLHVCKEHAVVVSKACPGKPAQGCAYDAAASKFECGARAAK